MAADCLELWVETRAAIMNRPKSETKGTLDFYRGAFENGGFWSCFGYDGLAVIFDLPLESIRSLSEAQKRDLMRLLSHLADATCEDLRRELQVLEGRSEEDRLAGIVRLSGLDA